jgi:hypothetical protein
VSLMGVPPIVSEARAGPVPPGTRLRTAATLSPQPRAPDGHREFGQSSLPARPTFIGSREPSLQQFRADVPSVAQEDATQGPTILLELLRYEQDFGPRRKKPLDERLRLGPASQVGPLRRVDPVEADVFVMPPGMPAEVRAARGGRPMLREEESTPEAGSGSRSGTRRASSLPQRGEHHEGQAATGRISPSGAEPLDGLVPFGIVPRRPSTTRGMSIEKPVDGRSARLGDPREVHPLRHPTATFVDDQGVPRDARLTGERDLGEAEALTQRGDPAPISAAPFDMITQCLTPRRPGE